MELLTIENMLSIMGGKKTSKECDELANEIDCNWTTWDTSTRDSKIREWNDKCSK